MQAQRERRAAHPEKERAWVAQNKSRVLKSKAAYRKRNEDRLRREDRERMRAHRERPGVAEALADAAREYQREHRAERNAYVRAARARNPAKFRARDAVKKAIRTGRLKRPATCADCGARGRLHAHHEDYERRLDVTFLCTKCHLRGHRKAG